MKHLVTITITDKKILCLATGHYLEIAHHASARVKGAIHEAIGWDQLATPWGLTIELESFNDPDAPKDYRINPIGPR